MRTSAAIVVALVGIVAACDRHDDATPPPAIAVEVPKAVATGRPVAAGPLRGEPVVQRFCVYHLSPQKKPAREVAGALAAAAGFQVTDNPLAAGRSKPVAVIATLSPANVRPPDLASLEFRGRQLSVDERQRLQHPSSATLVTFMARGAAALPAYRAALGVTRELARRTDGIVEDEIQREERSATAMGRPLEGWSGDEPDVRRHVTLDMYRDGELLRIVSVGMEKLGLPDLVVNNVASRDSQSMGSLMNAVLQTMLERGALTRAGELDLSLDELRHPALRESLKKSVIGRGTGKATVHLADAGRQEGDADNRLIELVFPDAKEGLQVAQDELLASIFGSEDKATYTKTDDLELLAARARAKKTLAKLKPRMSPHPPDMEHLLVKAPFVTRDGGTEWMWIEVLRWEGHKISGILENDPYDVDRLKAGARVEVDDGSLYDYQLTHRDGTSEGNETGKILMARDEAAKR